MMNPHRGVFAWYLALWLVLALAPAAYALFGAVVDVGGAWKRLCGIVLATASAAVVPGEPGEAVRRARPGSSVSDVG